MDREEQNYIAALILGCSGRQLSREQTAQVLEVLEMTELMRIVEQKVTKKGWQEGQLEANQATARRLLALGIDVPIVADATGLTEDAIRRLGAREN